MKLIITLCLMFTATTIQAAGWTFDEVVDDGEIYHMVYKRMPGVGISNSLYVICRAETKTLGIFITWDKFQGSKGTITSNFQFDKKMMLKDKFNMMGDDKTSTVYLNDDDPLKWFFVEELQASNKLVVRVSDADSKYHMATFSLMGFTKAFSKTGCAADK